MPDTMPRPDADDEDIELVDAPPVEEGGEEEVEAAKEQEPKKDQKEDAEDEFDEFGDDFDDDDMNEVQLKAEPPSSPPKPTPSKIPAVKPESKLEGIFDDDDDDDDEYGMGKEDDEKFFAEQNTMLKNMGPSDPEVMMAFYQRLFPFRPLFQWLNHSAVPSKDFAHREFAFDLISGSYMRFQSFVTADLLRREIVKLNPTRFEIGPVYSANPRDRKQLRKAAFYPKEKELVFDIDMTDYDDIRTCCTGANICPKCWAWVTMAIKIMDVGLKEDFGFKHVMWVYSGRRGAHAWICDKRARSLDDQGRKAITNYFEVVKGGQNSGKKVNLKRPLHPHLARSFEILKGDFQTRILEDQDPWATPENAAKLLALIPDRALADALRQKWATTPTRTSLQKWSDIDTLAKSGVSSKLDAKQLVTAKQDIILEYMYPRLDAKVSKQSNHLLKSPFCVHPKTGRVCVPIDAARAEEFDPFTVPTVTQLLGEVNEFDRRRREEGEKGGEGGGDDGQEEKAAAAAVVKKEEAKIPDYDKTSLKPYVDAFKLFISKLLKDEAAIKREAAGGSGADSMEF